MSAPRYNGYTNYETWCVCLWLDNDEPEYNYWLERARFVTDRGELAEELKSHHFEVAHDSVRNLLLLDLVLSSLKEVNWYEVSETRYPEDEKEESHAS